MLLVTWSSECDQQVELPLLQSANISVQQYQAKSLQFGVHLQVRPRSVDENNCFVFWNSFLEWFLDFVFQNPFSKRIIYIMDLFFYNKILVSISILKFYFPNKKNILWISISRFRISNLKMSNDIWTISFFYTTTLQLPILLF